MASNDIDLLTYAKRARAVGWSSIPVNQDKQPDISSVIKLRDLLPSDLMLDEFFGINKKQTTVAVAVLVDSNKLAIDLDGYGEKIFITKVLPRLKSELKKKVERTTHTKSPHGSHFLGKTNVGNDKIAKKSIRGSSFLEMVKAMMRSRFVYMVFTALNAERDMRKLQQLKSPRFLHLKR
jgi:hypothetical protein